MRKRISTNSIQRRDGYSGKSVWIVTVATAAEQKKELSLPAGIYRTIYYDA